MTRKKPACTLLVAILILGIVIASGGTDPEPKLFVDPPTYTAVELGEVFTIDINIANVTDLLAFDLKLGYNTTLLDALDAVIGPFPNQPFSWYTTEIHEPEGYVRVAATSMSAVDGNGTVATITFKATYEGAVSCTLDLYDTIFYDSYAVPISHSVEDGNYNFAVPIVTVATDKRTYLPGENVSVYGNLTLGDTSFEGLVALQVTDPRGSGYGVARTLEVGATPPPGNITIFDLYSCDMLGNPKDSFGVDTQAYFNVTIRNNGTEWTYVTATVNAYDENMVPLGLSITLYNDSIAPDTYTWVISSIYIPGWAVNGNGMVYASAFTDDPKNGGAPYCPEKSDTFQITGGGEGGGGAPETQGSGDYNLTFKLSPDAWSGIYRVYANTLYHGRYAVNNTVFGINVIFVPDDYPTIQMAVNAANTTHNTVIVFPRIYNEHLTINKANLRLVGIDPDTTIISGSGTGNVITVTADNVKISSFTIQNSGSFPNSGIYLTDSSGSIISNNVVTSSNGYGINIHSSNNISMSSNTLQNNDYGIYLTNSESSIINNNVVTSNNGYGIYLINSKYSAINNNVVTSNNGYGIYLNHFTSATLRDNNMISNKYNFGVFGDSLADFTQDIDATNTVDGKPIVYWVNQYSRTVPSYAGFVALVSSTNITVRDLDLTKNGQGLLLAFTTNSLIERVTTTSNEYGIYLYNSGGNSLANNTMADNKYNFGLYGVVEAHFNNTIYLSNTVDSKPVYYVKDASNTVYNSSTNAGTLYLIDCTNITIGNLTLTKNVNGIFLWNTANSKIQNVTTSNNLNGIYLDSSNNSIIYHNSFIDNTIQAKVTESYNNVWDDGYPSGGNYWSEYIDIDFYSGPYQNETGNDGIWDREYVINVNNIDNYPLISPLTPPVYNIDTHLGYTKIQEAIDAPQTSNGNTIIVRVGTYPEHVTIDKSLTLIGINGSTIIDGSGTGTVVNITANQVTLRGFTIQRSGNSTTNQGILLFHSNNTVITQSNITKNKHGIRLYQSDNCSISENHIKNNTETGIHIETSSGNYIYGNKMAYNDMGIKLISSNNNTIYYNDFINNTQQLYNYSSANTWDDGDGRGNYWSDYVGADDGSNNRTAGDGVGDTFLPHQGVDWYPLMEPGMLVHDIAIISVTPVIQYCVNFTNPHPGWIVNITVTLKNTGTFTETSIDITAYYEGNPIQTKTIPQIAPLTEIAINLTWDTTDVPSCYNYTISAYAHPVPGENVMDQGDNTLEDGEVYVRLMGDVNEDDRVRSNDMILLGKALYTEPGDPKWNPNADVNGDGRIKSNDIILLGKHLFEECTP